MMATTILPGTAERAVLTAVVHDADGVRFVASGHVEAELTKQLVAYVRERCEHTLWPADAREVQSLIADSRWAEAIDAYFANVGDRWDMERLESPTRHSMNGAWSPQALVPTG